MINWKLTYLLTLPIFPISLASSTPPIPMLASIFSPPQNNTGEGGDWNGGGRRDGEDCPDVALSLTSFVPTQSPNGTALLPTESPNGGYTTADRPSVWVYLPFALSEETPAQLTVVTSDGTDIAYESEPITASEPGFLRLPIEASLAVGGSYTWDFSVYCNDPNMNDVPASTLGWIERVEPGTIPANQIWYDLLAEAAVAGRQNPRAPEWVELLEFVEEGDALVGQPLLP